jgi:hypothetical protein
MLLAECEKFELDKKAGESDPWFFFGIANISLARLVLNEGKDEAKEVLDAFLGVFEKVGAKGHLKAQFEQMDILTKCLEASTKTAAKTLLGRVQELRAGFESLEK